jgi:MerR family transcriptional regulator, light-induced transcriptional regulator
MTSSLVNEEQYLQFLQALLSGRREICHNIVADMLKTDIEIKDLYVHLFQRALYQVGEMWETNKISVATEHIATAITEGLLTLIYPRIFEAAHSGKKAVIACVPNEFHQIGAKMVADTFELNGWDGHFVGANTPTSELINKLQETEPDVIGLSLSIYFNYPHFVKMITEIRKDFPKTPIWVGGQAFRWGGKEIAEKHDNILFIESLYELEQQLNA